MAVTRTRSRHFTAAARAFLESTVLEIVEALVILVLETALSNTAISVTSTGQFLTIVKDGVPEVLLLPKEVTRRMVLRLANRYGVNVEWFYHPEMLHKGPIGKQ